MVNVTTLLVLTTLFISVSDGLPRTSYVKLIDAWLIVCLMVPFVEIILQGSVHQSRLSSRFAFQCWNLPQLLSTRKNVQFHLNLCFNLSFWGVLNVFQIKNDSTGWHIACTCTCYLLRFNTACRHRMAHRKWKETKQHPGTAGPDNMLGCCLVSFHFLWAILSTSTVPHI